MKTLIEFAKLSGSGNDFICIDNRDGRYDKLLESEASIGHFARTLCRRGMGIGADGVIFACKPEIEGVADLAARFFEADGSETELCGNGTACFVHWSTLNEWTQPGKDLKILTPAGVVRGKNGSEENVTVCIPDPFDIEREIDLVVEDRRWKCDLATVGTPHLVVPVEDIEDVDVNHWGYLLRHHERFAPRGVNVNFVETLAEGEIAIRTFEFGVEGETLACGTGSSAAAILTATREQWSCDYLSGRKDVQVHARSGDMLKINFSQADDGAITDVCLETIVRFAFIGLLEAVLAQEAVSPPIA